MKNIALAVLNFESRYSKFPPAATVADGNRHGPFVYLLPFFEEGAVFDRIDFTEDWDEGVNQVVERGIHIGGILVCPSAPLSRYDLNGTPGFEELSQNQVSDYAPSTSINAYATTPGPQVYNGLEIRPLSSLVDNGIRTDIRQPPAVNNIRWWGIMQEADTLKDANIRSANIKDGLSTTMLYFEVAGRPEHNASGRRVLPPDAKRITAFRWASTSLPISINRTCRDKSMMNCENSGEVYSFHTGGAYISMADGAVRFMNEDIDPEAFVSLYTMAGGDVVSEQELGL